jgi:hypothetical protein
VIWVPPPSFEFRINLGNAAGRLPRIRSHSTLCKGGQHGPYIIWICGQVSFFRRAMVSLARTKGVIGVIEGLEKTSSLLLRLTRHILYANSSICKVAALSILLMNHARLSLLALFKGALIDPIYDSNKSGLDDAQKHSRHKLHQWPSSWA